MLTQTDLIAHAMHLPPPEIKAEQLEPGTKCAITGTPITVGYPVMDIVTDATGEFLDTFRGNPHGYLSPSAAACFKASNPKSEFNCHRAVMVFEDGTYYRPLISAEAAANQGRPSWSALVRDVWPGRAGEQCVILLTTDMKKRLWPRARIGALGHSTPVLVYDSGSAIHQVVSVNWPAMLDELELFERIYSAGFVKQVIGQSLWLQPAVCASVGYKAVRMWEAELVRVRRRCWFSMVSLIAQKAQEEKKTHAVDI